MTVTPCSSSTRRKKAPAVSPNTRSSGSFSSITIVTDLPSAVSDAADLAADEAAADAGDGSVPSSSERIESTLP